MTAAILKNPDGSVCRENGKLRMYFAAVDFPHGTYKHDLYETTSRAMGRASNDPDELKETTNGWH